jgi:hypothetical protein
VVTALHDHHSGFGLPVFAKQHSCPARGPQRRLIAKSAIEKSNSLALALNVCNWTSSLRTNLAGKVPRSFEPVGAGGEEFRALVGYQPLHD